MGIVRTRDDSCNNAAEKRHGQGVPTVEEAAAEVLAQQRPGWRNAKYPRDWPRSLRAYAFPRIGALPVSAVTTADVLAILTPIWHEKSQTAQRVRQRISAVMKWAIAMGYRPDNPAGDALGRQQAVVQHMRALPHGAVADALATVRTSPAPVTTQRAFEFLVLTAARSGEVRLATWDEMDLDAGVWAIPAPRMKAKRDHRVPLSGRASTAEPADVRTVRMVVRTAAISSVMAWPKTGKLDIVFLTRKSRGHYL